MIFRVLFVSSDDSGPGHKIMQALKDVDVDVEKMQKEEKLLGPADGKTICLFKRCIIQYFRSIFIYLAGLSLLFTRMYST